MHCLLRVQPLSPECAGQSTGGSREQARMCGHGAALCWLLFLAPLLWQQLGDTRQQENNTQCSWTTPDPEEESLWRRVKRAIIETTATPGSATTAKQDLLPNETSTVTRAATSTTTSSDLLANETSTVTRAATSTTTSSDLLVSSKRLATTVPSTTVSSKRLATTVPSTTVSRERVATTVPSTTGKTTVVLMSSTTAKQYPILQLLEMATTAKNMSDMIGVINDVLLYISNMDGTDIPQSEVPLILDILGNITQNAVLSNLNFSIGVFSNVITIANHLLAKRIWEPAARVNSKLGPQLLQSMEDLLCSLAPMQKPFNVSSSNVQMYCSVRPCSEASNGNSMAVTPEVNVSLPGHSFAPNCKATFLSVSFHTLGTNFPSDYEGDNGPRRVHNINSKIMTNVMKLGTEINHNANINITFTCSDKWCNETAICVFWNATLGRWSSDGCVTQVNNRVSKCICAHLTSYAVLMSMSEPQIDAVNDAILSRITNVGLVVSMGCLVLCIALQAILVGNAGNLMASYRHVAILNISLCLLFSNAFFLVSSNIQVHAFELNCFALTFCIHFSLLAFFCWTLVQTLFLVCRLVFVFHHVTKREFTALAIILGYACPITISVATLLYFYPMHRYRKRDVCWLDSTSGASYAFTIPTIIILVGNFLGLVIVLRTLLRPSVSDAAREDEEVVKKLVKAVVFCTPQFGLTWAIGIPLLTNGNSLVLNYLFVLLNPLQGCFILVFACLMDKKVMDLLKRRFAKDPPEKSSDTTLSSA